jgi:hypothetical protein
MLIAESMNATDWVNVIGVLRATSFYLSVVGLGFMAMGAVVIFIINVADRDRFRSPWGWQGGIAPFLSLGGVLGFCTGLGLLMYDKEKYLPLGVVLAGGGFLALGGSILLNAAMAKAKRAVWPIVSARCTDQKLRKIAFSSGDGVWDGWRWLLTCEINYAGKNYRVTPRVRWSDASQQEEPFRSKKRARRFIAQTITSSGDCKLRVNPKNPLESELLAQSI